MPSRGDERFDAMTVPESGRDEDEQERRPFERLNSNSSSEMGSTSDSGSSSPDSPESVVSDVYPEAPESGCRDKRLHLESSLHRLLSFPLGIASKLRLNLEALAEVGFFWNIEGRLECFKCGQLEHSVTSWQDLTQRQVRMRHYDCTHPSDDDVPPSRAASCYNYEAHRRYTFYQESWTCTAVDAAELATSGFYYTGKGDVCKCYFCNLEVSNWEEGDTPIGEHERWNKDCPFLTNRPVGNFKLGEELERGNVGRDNAIFEIRPFARAENDTSRYRRLPDVVPRDLTIEMIPVHMNMETYEARLATYTNWPKEKAQQPSDLSEAGFFYNGKDDEVLCFHCDGGLKDWAPEDEPWVLHAKWFSCCHFLQTAKSKEFVTSVQRVHKPIMSLKDFKEALSDTERTLNSRLENKQQPPIETC